MDAFCRLKTLVYSKHQNLDGGHAYTRNLDSIKKEKLNFCFLNAETKIQFFS